MFDFQEIKKLIELVQSNEIGELEVSRLWGRIKIRKRPAESAQSQQPVYPLPAIMSQVPPAEPKAEPEAARSGDGDQAPAADLVPVRAPMVGTFYRAPAPDAEPYVNVGADVHPGQVLCIIEAMKLMNEIESEVSGKIVKVLVENAQPVQYDQTLFLVQAG